MSKLKAINIFIVQWFFFRITRVIDDNDIQTHWGIIFPIIPLTGWRSKYIPRKYFSINIFKIN